MLLIRTEATNLFKDPYQQALSGQGSANVSDPFSYSVGFGQTIALAPNTVGQAVALPFSVAGYFLRLESLAAIQFSIDPSFTFYQSLTLPSSSAAGYPLTGVCLMMTEYTTLLLSNPTSNTVWVDLLVAGV